MATTREELRQAVQTMLNDVIEQGFHHLISHPQNSNELNNIIHEASTELNYQLLKVDSHSFKPNTSDLENHYKTISKDTQRMSLDLLSRLQRVQQFDKSRLKRL